MKKLVVAFVTLSSALALAGTPAVFSDSFEVPPSFTLPPPWMESNETNGGSGETCVGANTISVNNGQMVFTSNASVCDPWSAYYQNAVAMAPLEFAFDEGTSLALFYDFGVPMGDYAYLTGLGSMASGPCALTNGVGLSPAVVPCDGFVIRLSSSSGMTAAAKSGATGGRRPADLPTIGQYLVVEIGPVVEGGFYGVYGGMSAMPVAPGTMVNVALSLNPFEGINVMVTIPDQPPVMVNVGGPGPSKRLTKALPSVSEPGMLLYFADADNGTPLFDSSNFTNLAATEAQFDNIALFGDTPGGEPITARVAARGKFKKAPINIKTKGKVQATVFGSGSLDPWAIDWTSVRFGATGGESSVAASGPPVYFDVDKDGNDDAIFTFPKSATATPCGTTSITVSGSLGGVPLGKRSVMAVPGAQPFSGSDSVKITGCPAPRRR